MNVESKQKTSKLVLEHSVTPIPGRNAAEIHTHKTSRTAGKLP